MSEDIPKPIRDEFKILNKHIKYPTYHDQEFQNSILDDINFNNYTEENIKNTFNQFLTTFTNCKNLTYEIISKNLHNIQEYCFNLDEKTMNYFLFLFIRKIYFFNRKKILQN